MKTRAFLILLAGLFAGAAQAASLSGVVTRSDTDEPVAGATVLLRGTGLTGLSAADGTYQIADVPLGSFGATCSAPDLRGASAGAQYFDQDRTRDFHLDPPAEGTLAITGTTTCDGTPCAGVLVEVRHDSRTQALALSQADGSYGVVGLAEGTWDVRGIRRGYLLAEVTALEATLAAPPVVPLALTSAPGTYTISGLVGLSDNPLDKSGSTVRLFGEAQPTQVQTTTGGGYTLSGAPAGLLSLTASHAGYDPHSRTDVLVQGDRELNFVLTKQGGTDPGSTHTVSGTVRLEDPDGGDPFVAAGSRVSIWDPDSGDHQTTSTHGDGTYSLTGIAAGSYLVSAAREGYLEQTPQAIDLAANQGIDFELSLDPDYDWGPGRGDGVLGCASAGQGPAALPFLLALLALTVCGRRRP